jgi:hypothetical protein
MAIIRRTVENIRRMKPRVNRAKITATTEADIRRHMSEDGENESYIAERAARADIPKALRILKRAGVGRRPVKGDELPRSVRKQR